MIKRTRSLKAQEKSKDNQIWKPVDASTSTSLALSTGAGLPFDSNSKPLVIFEPTVSDLMLAKRSDAPEVTLLEHSMAQDKEYPDIVMIVDNNIAPGKDSIDITGKDSIDITNVPLVDQAKISDSSSQ